MRSLLSRKEEPVSVISMIASTRSGTLTSVAPQENSTSTFTPARSKIFSSNCFSGNALSLQIAHAADRGEFSGTTNTQRVGPERWLLNDNSASS